MQPAPANSTPETNREPPTERPPAAPSPVTANNNDSHLLGYIFTALACLTAFALGGFYYFRRQSRTTKAASPKVLPVDSPGGASGAPVGQNSLRSDQVELLIGEIFRRQGYTVELSAAVNTDDGIDLMLRRDSETTLVQCKHWAAARVTAREVRDFYGAMAAGGAPHGILVTMGAFTPDALDFAPTKGIELLDGRAVAAKITAAAKPGENLCVVSSWIDDFTAHARIFDPECPVCHSTMVIRHNRANGTPSWGCRNHPRCPGRREPRLDLLPSSAAN
jgi:restriction system protein